MEQMAVASKQPAADQVVQPPQQQVEAVPPKEEEHIQQSQPEKSSPPPTQSSPAATDNTAAADHGSELTKDQQGVMDAVQEMDSRCASIIPINSTALKPGPSFLWVFSQYYVQFRRLSLA